MRLADILLLAARKYSFSDNTSCKRILGHIYSLSLSKKEPSIPFSSSNEEPRIRFNGSIKKLKLAINI